MPETPKLTPDQLARQLKKIAKDKRKKIYDDQQVQGTNNSSIVSKRSVEVLYTKKLQPELGEWFKYFVPKGKRRSPAINRGYWIRMETIFQMIMRIIKLNPGNTVNIINLGCGFDPLPFQLLSRYGETVELCFIDIDYPDLVQNKYDLIQKSQEIRDLIGLQHTNNICKISTENYKLVGCDLKNLNYYQEILPELVGTESVNIFIAEVSLAYMKPEFANPVIEISSKVPNSHFVILEQIMPDSQDNSFATKMLYHFNHLRSPIQCVERYPSKQLQLERFKQYYNFVEIKNLFENWLYLVSDDMKERITQVEEFDEWEEFIIFCQHYVVVHGTNINQLVYDEINGEIETKEYPINSSVTMSLDNRFDPGQLEIKFPAVAAIDSKIYVNGGLTQTRTDEMLELDLNNGTITSINMNSQPSARMCHSLITVDNKLVLIGGRTRPGMHFQDVYLCTNKTWVKLPDMPVKRSRHACVVINESEILIFGGLLEEDNINDNLFLKYNVRLGTFSPLFKINGDCPGNLLSCSMSYNGEYGYIFGGISNHNVPVVNDKLYRFNIEEDKMEIKAVYQDYLLSRIGSQCELIDNNKLLVVGGVSPIKMLTNKTNMMTLELNDFTWKSIEIPQEIRKQHPPIFIGFGLSHNNQRNSYFILGGGAVCYSFGSCFNAVYRLDLS